MPLTLRWGTCPYHGEQAIWLLDGIDVDKQAMRTFSWADFGSDAERAILREILLGNTVHASRKGITN